MAFTDFYCNSGGSNLNAGSTTGAAIYTATNGGWNSGTGVFTPTSGNPSLTVNVGDFASIYADGSTVTGFVGRVTAVSSTTITVSTTAKSGTAPSTSASGISCNVGGAWLGPNGTSGFPIGFIQSTMTDSSSSPPFVNLQGNFSISFGLGNNQANAGPIFFGGYTTTPRDGGRATITQDSNRAVAFEITAADIHLQDLIFTNNGSDPTGGSACISVSSAGIRTRLERIHVENQRGAGIHILGASTLIECSTYNCNTLNTSSFGGFILAEEGTLIRCVSNGNVGNANSGFVVSTANTEPISFIECISDGNGQYGLNITASTFTVLKNCVFSNNTSHGVHTASFAAATNIFIIENCIFSSNGGYGINYTTSNRNCLLKNNAFYNNTSGQTNNINSSLITSSVTLSGDPFVDDSNGNFSPNNTIGAGASVKEAGRGSFPQSSYSSSTISYVNIGAVMHRDNTVSIGNNKDLLLMGCGLNRTIYIFNRWKGIKVVDFD